MHQKTTVRRKDFRFQHRLRVRWAEVDMQKIVFNAHYLMYFDTAMGDYWRALALPYEASMLALGGDLYVKKASLEYHGSARYDDQLDIGLRCTKIGNSSILFTAGIFRSDDLLVSAELLYVFADPLTQKSQAVPTNLRAILDGFEAGEPMLKVVAGPWSELREAARSLRSEVFLQEQRIPIELEWDDADEAALHAVAFNHLGAAVATGRLLQHSRGIGKIGRMAVTRVLRGTGAGRQILQTLVQAATHRGDRELLLHAQTSAKGFYQAQGFATRGELFDEAGIEHIEMFKTLNPAELT
ncbi:MAG: YbgC/FadM family acyl-CoA thioesterase [Burkholderiaceae bacterium]